MTHPSITAEEQKSYARLRAKIFSLVAQNAGNPDPDKILAKSQMIYNWIKEGK